MFNILSILIGLFALLWAMVAFLPLIGALNWFVILIAIVGLVFGVLSSHTSGRNLNLIVIAISAFRLWIGGGLP